ncbi:protein-glutamine glutaminase family protein [Flavobacterium myungsuense]|uniref:protein-glutamine glutaminase family protein n=1 Tax=Flavobacterium myungsuense TaxID=651823 RepID=UPI00362F200A
MLTLELPFGYQQANCHNLSHYICLYFESKKITTSKIWAFTPGIYSDTSTKLISFTDKKSYLQTEKLTGDIM